jgi:hypothetical protein
MNTLFRAAFRRLVRLQPALSLVLLFAGLLQGCVKDSFVISPVPTPIPTPVPIHPINYYPTQTPFQAFVTKYDVPFTNTSESIGLSAGDFDTYTRSGTLVYSAAELGFAFRSSVSGTILGLGTMLPATGFAHTVTLWDSATQLVLATATVTNQSPSIFTYADFSATVPIQADHGYVVGSMSMADREATWPYSPLRKGPSRLKMRLNSTMGMASRPPIYSLRLQTGAVRQMGSLVCVISLLCNRGCAEMFAIVFTGRLQTALPAFRRPRHTDISSVQDQPVMGDMDHFAGNELQQLLLGGKRRFSVHGQADTGGDAEDMGIDGHIRLVIDNGSDYIGGFATDAWQTHQFFNGQRYLAAEVMNQHLGHADQVFRFVVGIRDAANKREQVVEMRFSKAGGIRIFIKNSRGCHIDPLIGALRRQDNRHQELVWSVIQ